VRGRTGGRLSAVRATQRIHRPTPLHSCERVIGTDDTVHDAVHQASWQGHRLMLRDPPSALDRGLAVEQALSSG